MYNVEDVLKYNIKVPYPRWIKGMDQKCCFATNIGWVLLKNDGKKESVMMIKNLDKKIAECVKNFRIIVQKTSLDKEFEIQFLQNQTDIEIKDTTSDRIENKTKELNTTKKCNELSNVKFDFMELEEDIENKFLRKNNLIRIYMTWTDAVNIRSFDKKRTYIEVYDSKSNKLGIAEYRSRETEKTLMFVYKIGKEKLSQIKINSKVFDGYIRDKQNVLIENVDKLFTFDVNVNLKD